MISFNEYIIFDRGRKSSIATVNWIATTISRIEDAVQNPIERYAYTNTIIIEYEVTNDGLIINVIFGYNRSNMRTTALGCIVIIGDVLIGHITYGNYYVTVKLNQCEELEWKSIKIEYYELNFSLYPCVTLVLKMRP